MQIKCLQLESLVGRTERMGQKQSGKTYERKFSKANERYQIMYAKV